MDRKLEIHQNNLILQDGGLCCNIYHSRINALARITSTLKLNTKIHIITQTNVTIFFFQFPLISFHTSCKILDDGKRPPKLMSLFLLLGLRVPQHINKTMLPWHAQTQHLKYRTQHL